MKTKSNDFVNVLPKWLLACLMSSMAMASGPADDAGEIQRVFSEKVQVQGATLTVTAGVYRVAGQDVRVEQERAFEIAGADVGCVTDEPLKLSKDKPNAWAGGTALRALRTAGGINAFQSFVTGSLTIRKSIGGEPLTEGKDYLLGNDFGMVGIGLDSTVTPDDTVYASYRYQLMRVDSVFVDALGRAVLVKGTPDIAAPVPPAAPMGAARLCNIFRPYGANDLKSEHLFPILESASQAVTRTTRGRLPQAVAKIKAGKPLTIVCWGDSVTTGGDAGRASLRYVDQFRTMLTDGLENTCQSINVINISVGGSTTQQWFATNPPPPGYELTFERVLAVKPDVLTMEFVNDAYLDEAAVEAQYSAIMEKLKPLGTELVLITPHFTTPAWMKMTSLREADERPYVKALYAFADKHHVAVADASSRWGHLWKEGLPYVTLLRNTLNHPDERGHRLFAEELLKCFEPAEPLSAQ